jgi:hypothetical protein
VLSFALVRWKRPSMKPWNGRHSNAKITRERLLQLARSAFAPGRNRRKADDLEGGKRVNMGTDKKPNGEWLKIVVQADLTCSLCIVNEWGNPMSQVDGLTPEQAAAGKALAVEVGKIERRKALHEAREALPY